MAVWVTASLFVTLWRVCLSFFLSLCFLLAHRGRPPAEADGVEEAAVARGARVAAAGLGQTGLRKVRAPGHRRRGRRFGGRGWASRRNRDRFGLLEGGEDRKRETGGR